MMTYDTALDALEGVIRGAIDTLRKEQQLLDSYCIHWDVGGIADDLEDSLNEIVGEQDDDER